MRESVLILKGLREFLDIPSQYEEVSQTFDDLQDTIESQTFSDSRDYIPSFIVITNLENYNKSEEFLSILPSQDGLFSIVILGTEDELLAVSEKKDSDIFDFLLKQKITSSYLTFLFNKNFKILRRLNKNIEEKNENLAKLLDTRDDMEDLINIGKSLSLEKDPDNLLRLILFLSKKITGADAGSIYLVELDEQGKKQLRFKYSHTFSREIPLVDFTLEMNKKSIAGYVAVTGEVLNIPNVYLLQDDTPYKVNDSFDKKNNYISRSMLVVPMRNHIDEIIGVIQLINSKENLGPSKDSGNEAFSLKLEKPDDFDKHVVTFNPKYDNLLESIAGQAAISIENNTLIKQIENQFEEFVRASVTAIESRDPATSGHSFRVAELCTSMANAVNDVSTGYLSDFQFPENSIRELEFAALLHDFGKVYIDLAIFKKAKKLFPRDRDNLIMRLDYLFRFVELQYATKEKSLIAEQLSTGIKDDCLKDLLHDKESRLQEISDIKNRLLQLNEPSVMEDAPQSVINDVIEQIVDLECVDTEGKKMEVLTDCDIKNLTIRRGSLNPEERIEIESHVVHTYNFVSKIPWPPEYRNIPEIALRHHELLDGTGYPDGLKGRDNILLQSRMMTIADIFDALTASDRPYKKAVPLERVLSILKKEGEEGKLDLDLVSLFIEYEVYTCLEAFQ